KNYGIEIDLRPFGDKLILEHDPFRDGTEFSEFIKHYDHSGLILNIKSEGIEFKVLNILEKHNIKDYFFLDCSFPACIKLIKEKNKNFAVRLSEWESLETCLKLKGKAG